MAGWPHRLHGHEFEQALGGGEGQGSLVCLVHGISESDMTERLNNSFFFGTSQPISSDSVNALHCPRLMPTAPV